VIVVAVRWYLRYGLSYRDVEELLLERGVEVDHVTVFGWVQRFTPLLARRRPDHRLVLVRGFDLIDDARDAYAIADAARTLPHTLRRVDARDEASAELEALVGFDDDVAGESTRVSNRIRGLLTQIHPPLERVLGPKVAHPAALELTRVPGALRQHAHPAPDLRRTGGRDAGDRERPARRRQHGGEQADRRGSWPNRSDRAGPRRRPAGR
jgi:hypothetical protein